VTDGPLSGHPGWPPAAAGTGGGGCGNAPQQGHRLPGTVPGATQHAGAPLAWLLLSSSACFRAWEVVKQRDRAMSWVCTWLWRRESACLLPFLPRAGVASGNDGPRSQSLPRLDVISTLAQLRCGCFLWLLVSRSLCQSLNVALAVRGCLQEYEARLTASLTLTEAEVTEKLREADAQVGREWPSPAAGKVGQRLRSPMHRGESSCYIDIFYRTALHDHTAHCAAAWHRVSCMWRFQALKNATQQKHIVVHSMIAIQFNSK
jgi:hypothetical protein